MGVLVTNCASALGSRIAESLLSYSIDVVGVRGYFPSETDHSNLRLSYYYNNFVFYDTTFQSFVSDHKYLYDREMIDSVIHLTEPDMSSIHNSIELTEYVLNSMKLIRCFERMEYKKKFILVSSADVYGMHSGPVTEESATILSSTESMDNSHVLSKLILERYLYDQKDDMDVYIVRTCNTYSSRGSNLIRDLIELMIDDKDIEYIKNPADHTTSYISDYDAADAITEILYEGISGRTYNVSSDKEVDLLSLLKMIEDSVTEVTGKPYTGTVRFSQDYIEGDIYSVSPCRLYEDTGFRPSMDLRKGIESLVRGVLNRRR